MNKIMVKFVADELRIQKEYRRYLMAKIVFITGGTGSGKSTIARLLAQRFPRACTSRSTICAT